MAAGVPVVASRVGGLTATVEDGRTGYLVPLALPGALRPSASELLLRNEPLRRSMGEAASRSMRRYAWGAVASELAALFGEAPD